MEKRIWKARVCEQKDEFKKFLIQEWNFLNDLKGFIADHAISTKRKIIGRMKTLEELFETW